MRHDLGVCRSPDYGTIAQHRSLFLFIFGLVLRERNHGAVPSRSNHDGSGVAFEGFGCSRRKDDVCVAGTGRRTFLKPDDNGNDTMATTHSTPFSLRTTIEHTDKNFPVSGICPTTVI